MPRRAKNGVRLWFRSLTSSYVLIWIDETGKQRQEDLGHADKRKAERQQAEKQAQLRCDSTAPAVTMRLSELLADYRERTRGQIAEGTMDLTEQSVRLLTKTIGDMDIHRVRYQHGERVLQAVLDGKGRAATANRHLRHLKAFFSLAVRRGHPYVFVSPKRYAHIQQLRTRGKWNVLHGRHPLNNLNQRLNRMLRRIGLAHLSYHDLRRTCLTNWAESGLASHETKALAGHSKIETTEQYYLRPRRRMLGMAKAASQRLISGGGDLPNGS